MMHIEIDFNGAMAVCNVTPFENPLGKMVNFNSADTMTQVYALSAFRTIKEHWEREQKLKKECKK